MPLQDNENYAKIVDLMYCYWVVNLSIVNVYHIRSNVNNNPDKIVAELKSKKIKHWLLIQRKRTG